MPTITFPITDPGLVRVGKYNLNNELGLTTWNLVFGTEIDFVALARGFGVPADSINWALLPPPGIVWRSDR